MKIRKTTLIFIITFFTICLLSCGEEGIRENLGEVYHLYDGNIPLNPKFSPAGNTIFFHDREEISEPFNYRCYVAIIGENGDNFNELGMGGLSFSSISGLSISPDGNWISFSGIEYEEYGKLNSERDIYKMSSDGSYIEGLGLEGKISDTCWSTDGEWIYFVWHINSPERDEIYRIRPDGTGIENIGIEHYDINSLSITNDNKYIVYIFIEGESSKLAVYSIEGNEFWVVVDEEDIGGYTIHSSCVSPDGRWICYSRASDTGGYDLFVVPFYGGESVKITKCGIGYLKLDGGDFSPDWSKDGKWIVFSAIRLNGEGIFKVKVPDEFLP
ncbi:MAG: hypothetical protein DRH49_04705 [Candidatus Coatesbacteria bacterium]|nr:MAG: hypothetical protein DRH49_04705 [Candidatus Coatesbacteria bacterium]